MVYKKHFNKNTIKSLPLSFTNCFFKFDLCPSRVCWATARTLSSGAEGSTPASSSTLSKLRSTFLNNEDKKQSFQSKRHILFRVKNKTKYNMKIVVPSNYALVNYRFKSLIPWHVLWVPVPLLQNPRHGGIVAVLRLAHGVVELPENISQFGFQHLF